MLSLSLSLLPTAFTHRSPKEARPCHFRDRYFLGAAVMAGHWYLFHVCSGSWLVYLRKSLCCHLHKSFIKKTAILRCSRRMQMSSIMSSRCDNQAQCD